MGEVVKYLAKVTADACRHVFDVADAAAELAALEADHLDPALEAVASPKQE